MRELDVVCPAGLGLAGPPVGGPAVLCRVFQREKAAADEITAGTYNPGLLTASHDPNAVRGFCCGTGVPVYQDVPEGGRATYTACPLWRAAREADWADEARVLEAERPSTTPFEGDPQLEGAIQHHGDGRLLSDADEIERAATELAPDPA